MKTVIIIPAREHSTRLACKMLAYIGGKPVIVHTYKRAVESGVGDVIVATDSMNICEAVSRIGGEVMMTDSALASGTDRIYTVWQTLDQKYDCIINLQGDLPFIEPDFIKETARIIAETNCDIATLATPITDDSYNDPSVVCPVVRFTSDNYGEAMYFSRAAIPHGGPYLNHVGIYGFRPETLEKFANLPQSRLEKLEKLEQLRALENGMTIGVSVLNKPSPIGIDVSSDLEKARAYYMANIAREAKN